MHWEASRAAWSSLRSSGSDLGCPTVHWELLGSDIGKPPGVLGHSYKLREHCGASYGTSGVLGALEGAPKHSGLLREPHGKNRRQSCAGSPGLQLNQRWGLAAPNGSRLCLSVLAVLSASRPAAVSQSLFPLGTALPSTCDEVYPLTSSPWGYAATERKPK